jgi:dTDP-glucose 4,6-dehydratase
LTTDSKTLLVTGGAGFIGANFVHQWSEKNPQDKIIVLDSLTYAGNASSLAGLANVSVLHASINDYELVLKTLEENQIKTLVHFAAESHVDRSIHGPDAFVETNVVGTHSLLKAAKKVWIDNGIKDHRFHHVSTDEVYGSLGPTDPAFHENTPYAPNSPYSASKAGSDHLVRAYHHTYGLNTTTTNCSNNYGPYQFPEKLIPLFLLNALHGKALPIYGDGGNVRDWLYVRDHCTAIELALVKGRPGEVYNVGGGEELPNLKVIDTLCAVVDAAFSADPNLAIRFKDAPAAKGMATNSLKTYVKDRPGHDRRYAIDETKIRSELGYKPSMSFEQGLSKTVNWYLSNQAWWTAIMDGSYRQWLEKNYA